MRVPMLTRVLGLALTVAAFILAGSAVAPCARADVVVLPQSVLVPSNYYYTDLIGGGIGEVAVMTGGGSGANVGDPSGRNDDGFRGPLPLGFTLEFFGGVYTEFWANNNGNISFTEGLAQYTPTGPQGAAEPIISPFFADVDTRSELSGVMHIRQDIADQLIVTWDAVGYYSQHGDLLNSFQLVVRGPNYNVPVGEGRIGFFYKSMQWETGDASGGVGGFGGTPGAVGFGDGMSSGIVLAGSIEDGISGVVDNTHVWFYLNNGIPDVITPEPSTLVLAGLGGVALLLARRRIR